MLGKPGTCRVSYEQLARGWESRAWEKKMGVSMATFLKITVTQPVAYLSFKIWICCLKLFSFHLTLSCTLSSWYLCPVKHKQWIINGDFGARITTWSWCVASLQEKVTEESVQRLKQRFMSAYDVTADGKLQIQEVLHELYVLNHSPISFTIVSFILKGSLFMFVSACMFDVSCQPKRR